MNNQTLFRCWLLSVVLLAAPSANAENPATGIRFSPEIKPGWDESLAELREAKEGFALFSINPKNQPEEVRSIYSARNDLAPIEAYFFDREETVCGEDERLPVRDTELEPWSGICQLVINMGNGRQAVGTGYLVSPRCVVTAGHCVHMGDGGSFFESVEVIPGCRGAVAPFGSQTSSNLRASERWRQEGRYADDYGAILLSEPFQPSQNGGVPRVVPFAVLPDSALQDATVHISGYPADKPFGTQFRDSDPISHTQAQRLRYMTDTYGGHSGSPVFFGGPEGPSVGIHNYGGCANKATRINENVAQAINTWIAAAGD